MKRAIHGGALSQAHRRSQGARAHTLQMAMFVFNPKTHASFATGCSGLSVRCVDALQASPLMCVSDIVNCLLSWERLNTDYRGSRCSFHTNAALRFICCISSANVFKRCMKIAAVVCGVTRVWFNIVYNSTKSPLLSDIRLHAAPAN